MRHRIKTILKSNKNALFISLAATVSYLVRDMAIFPWLIITFITLSSIAPIRHNIHLIRTGMFPSTLLPIIAGVAALIAKDYWTALAVIASATVMQRIESVYLERLRKSSQSLLDVLPTTTTILKGKTTTTIATSSIVPGSIVVVNPGEIIPLDGTIIEGSTHVQDVYLTGELTSTFKPAGAAVYAGSINQDTTIYVKVSRSQENSQPHLLSKIAHKSNHGNTATMTIINWLSISSATLVLISSAVIFYITANEALALMLLVTANPFALRLAGLLMLKRTLINLQKHGVYLRSPKSIDTLASLQEIFIDSLALQKVEAFTINKLTAYSESKETVRRITASLVSATDVAEWQPFKTHTSDIDGSPGIRVSKVNTTHIVGQSKQGRIELTYVLPKSLVSTAGNTPNAVYLLRNEQVIGMYQMHQNIENDTLEALATFKSLKTTLTLLASNDEPSSMLLAKKCNIPNLYANCSPATKIQIMQQALKKPTAYVTTDAADPALGAADSGIVLHRLGIDHHQATPNVTVLGFRVGAVSQAIMIVRSSLMKTMFMTAVALVSMISATFLAILLFTNPFFGLLLLIAQSIIIPGLALYVSSK